MCSTVNSTPPYCRHNYSSQSLQSLLSWKMLNLLLSTKEGDEKADKRLASALANCLFRSTVVNLTLSHD